MDDDAREALAAWDKAIEGDSGDAEYEAGLGMAEVLRALASAPDILARLWEWADDDEAETISQVARKAGILWQCHVVRDGIECRWDNREDEPTCGSCGAPRPRGDGWNVRSDWRR